MSKSLLIFPPALYYPNYLYTSLQTWSPEFFKAQQERVQAGVGSDTCADEVWTHALAADGTESCLHYTSAMCLSVRPAPWEYAIATVLLQEKDKHGSRISSDLSGKHHVILESNFSNNTDTKAIVFIW